MKNATRKQKRPEGKAARTIFKPGEIIDSRVKTKLCDGCKRA